MHLRKLKEVLGEKSQSCWRPRRFILNSVPFDIGQGPVNTQEGLMQVLPTPVCLVSKGNATMAVCLDTVCGYFCTILE